MLQLVLAIIEFPTFGLPPVEFEGAVCESSDTVLCGFALTACTREELIGKWRQ